MNPALPAIETERRLRERAVCLLVLTQANAARLKILHAVRDGDPVPELRLPDLAPALVRAMVDAWQAGYVRAGKLAGVDLDPEPAPAFDAVAEKWAQGIIDILRKIATDCVSTQNLGIIDALAEGAGSIWNLISRAFTALGWTHRDPGSVSTLAKGKAGYAAQAQASGIVLSSYGAGMKAGYRAPAVTVGLLRHVSVLDDRTTDICDERAYLTLPADHRYWLNNWPPLHFNCRSIVIPAPSGAQASDWLPEIPPDPGFGAVGGMMNLAFNAGQVRGPDGKWITTAYHGSPHEFKEFKVSGGEDQKYGPGVYFTTNAKGALGFGGNVYRVTLAHQQPFDTNRELTPDEIEEIHAAAGRTGMNGPWAGTTHGNQVYKGLVSRNGSSKANVALREAGYDGIVGSDGEITVFHPSQVRIKSVKKLSLVNV